MLAHSIHAGKSLGLVCLTPILGGAGNTTGLPSERSSALRLREKDQQSSRTGKVGSNRRMAETTEYSQGILPDNPSGDHRALLAHMGFVEGIWLSCLHLTLCVDILRS